jgi:hypothetical protein
MSVFTENNMKEDRLHNIKSSGYKAPNDYFKSFDAKLIERLDEEESIEGIETSGYTIPQEYFDSVEAIVLSKLNVEKKPVIKLRTKTLIYYVAGIAASFAVLLSLFFNSKDAISIDAINTMAIESYLYQEDYTNADLASLFNTDDISETNFIDLTISDEMLNQYLESIDTEDLILD